MWGDVSRQPGNTNMSGTNNHYNCISNSALPCPKSCSCVWYHSSIQGPYVLPLYPWSNDCSRVFLLLLLLLSYFFVRYNHALIKPLWYVSALILKATKWSPIPIRLLHSCFWTVSKKTQGYLHRSYRRHTLRWPSVCKYPYSLFSTTGSYDLLLPN